MVCECGGKCGQRRCAFGGVVYIDVHAPAARTYQYVIRNFVPFYKLLN